MIGGVGMAKENLVKETADKWEKLMSIGWSIKSGSEIEADLIKCKERMSHRQMDILMMLECLNINTVSEMADFLKISKSTLSIVMNKLVSKGYVTKQYPDSRGDGRRVYFKISPSGHDVLIRLGEQYIEGLSKYYSSFTDEGKELFSKGVASLRKANNSESTMFGLMTSMKEEYKKYDADIIQVAKDLAFFFINCRISSLEGDDIKLPYRITQNQFHLLLCILSGMDSLTKLEKHLGSSGSTLSIGVSKLVDRGYLYKTYPDSGQDGRMVFIKLTDEGKKVVAEVTELLHKHFADYLSTLSEENIEVFNYGCDCLLSAFETVRNF